MTRYIDFTKQPKPVQLAAHAIGLDYKRPYIRHGKTFYRPYRNYYTTGARSPESTIWKDLCEYGYANWRRSRNGGFTYWLTRAGLDWLGETLGITIYDEED